MASAKNKVSDRRSSEYEKTLKRVRERAKNLTVGVHEAIGAKQYEPPEREEKEEKKDAKKDPKKDAKKKGDQKDEGADPSQERAPQPLTIADLATFHEFGTSRIPARSFIRAWANENEKKHEQQLRALAKAVLAGKIEMDEGLKRLGALAVAEVQKRIADGIEPPLTQETIHRKGSSKPLIDTGQLRSSIHFALDGHIHGQAQVGGNGKPKK